MGASPDTPLKEWPRLPAVLNICSLMMLAETRSDSELESISPKVSPYSHYLFWNGSSGLCRIVLPILFINVLLHMNSIMLTVQVFADLETYLRDM